MVGRSLPDSAGLVDQTKARRKALKGPTMQQSLSGLPEGILAPVTPHWHDQCVAEVLVGRHEFAVVDVETTGLYCKRDRVVSVAVARCDASGHPLEQWYSLVNPGCPMGASEIHGITDVAVAHAPSFEHIADELLAQLGGAVLVGHNMTFDWRFLSSEYARGGETLPEHDAVCTLALARALGLPTENMKLDSVAAYCRVPLPRAQFHDAREDVLATAGVFSMLYPMALE